MNIQRCENELILFEKFQKNLLQCNSLVPGIAKKSKDLLSNRNYSFMCATRMKKDIETFFGKSNCFLEGEGNKSTFFAFVFKNEIIICTCESGGVGTGWYWVNSKEEGSRYENNMLLSCDKEVKNFWPDFCNDLKEIIQNKPAISRKSKIL